MATTGVKPQRRRTRRRKPSLVTVIWAIISLVLTIAFLVVQGVLLLTLMLVSMLVTTIAAFADFTGDEHPVPAPRAASPKSANPRGNGRGKTRKPGAGPRKRTCSARCRASTKPITDCRCSCAGKTHGAKNRDA